MTNLSIDEQAQLRQTAHALADAARAATLPYFRKLGLSADNKDAAGFDPVTAADRGSEQAMRAILARERPQDGILGEEFDDVAGSSGLTWVLDPIDGTRGFISGTPTWGVLIALSNADGPIYGIVDQPYIGERFEGGFGVAQMTGPQGAHALQVCDGQGLEAATLFTTFPEVGTDADRAGFEAVRDRVQLVRYGMDCYAYALLAQGQIDLVVEAGLQAYDIQAPMAVVQAAGGFVTNWRGQPVHEGGQVIAASSAGLHAEALALLAPYAHD
ncbi:histidinol-phosphatase [Cognatishimia sp. MH4019]|uniref:histidinol-phosphatase n=1 Tax=Cognatishimia sp. MH4019 TaxID=2854030 RepID=UPI001CD49622|nr:histidinol-phosphatase [Cognatishimia sp. MH4019]